jgi:hypothetical protein
MSRACVIAAAVGVAAGLTAAAFASSGSVILKDDLSRPNGHWVVRADPIGTTRYRDGAYWIIVRRPGQSTTSGRLFKTVRVADIQVDVTEESGHSGDAIGVECAMRAHYGYEVDVYPSNHLYAIVKEEGRSAKALVAARTWAATKTVQGIGEQNRLRAYCIGANGAKPSKIELFVNGRRVAQVGDPRGFDRFTGVALTVYSPHGGAMAAYRDLIVSTP